MKVDKLVVNGIDITEKVFSVSILSGNILRLELSDFIAEVQRSAEKGFNDALGIKKE